MNLPGGTATTYQLTTGTALVPVTQWRMALYAEDTIKLTPQLTASAGLRYEYETNPGSFANFGPRLSFSWSLDKKQAWILHARAGLFGRPTEAPVLTEVKRLDGTRQQEFTTYSAPFSPNAQSPSPAGSIRVSTFNQLPSSLAESSTFNAIV
jgi:hypothetical protein